MATKKRLMGAEQHCVSCTTFNILAPIYKRLDAQDQNCRESQYSAYWLGRNQRIIDLLLAERSSIICLQEVWLGNEELVDMYDKRLGNAGYSNYKLARTNNRGDGLLTAIHRDYFRVLNHQELLFNDFGDRVAQLLHVESVVPFWQSRHNNIRQQILIVNTHLLFPHDYTLCIVRLRQVYKILQCVESYQQEHKLSPMPIMLCGSVSLSVTLSGGTQINLYSHISLCLLNSDWNGSKRGHVYKFLRSQGFVSSYDTAHQYTDGDEDAHKWVSHRNHRGNICGVDFIWLHNPNKPRRPLKTSWNKAVFGIIKYHLRQTSLTEDNAFEFLKADSTGNYITFSGFRQALCQLGLVGHECGLSPEEIDDLWIQADADGNGVVNFEEFQRIWSSTWSEQPEQNYEEANKGSLKNSMEGMIFGLNVKDAVLFPPEVEKGTWPEDYSLSDHAPLTVVFSPVRMPFSG